MSSSPNIVKVGYEIYRLGSLTSTHSKTLEQKIKQMACDNLVDVVVSGG